MDNKIDRLPPHSTEIEQAILGCVFMDPGQCLPLCLEKVRVEAFYSLQNQTIYETFLELFEDGIEIDTVSVVERLKMWDKLEACGGINYLSNLPDAVTSTVNLPYYIDELNDKHSLRRMISACTEVVGRCYQCETDADELMDTCERDILQISESRVQPSNKTMHALIVRAMHEIEDSHENQGVLSGLSTGFQEFDRMTSGLQAGDMVVVAARPSMGKTSLAMNIAEHVAVNLHLGVGVCSLEMTAEALVKRMLCSRARVNMRNVRDGFLADRDFPKLTTSAGKLDGAPIYIDDTAGQSILQIRAKMRRWKQQYDIKLGVIDYLQLANALGGRRRYDNRQQEVSEISCGVKNLAKELGIPVIVLSQMNREFEREKNRKPRLSDLRESGSIEQDGDIISFLYKPHLDEDEDQWDNAIPINLLIAKQRNGPTGEIPLTFLKHITRFESGAKVSDEDIPPSHQQELTVVPEAETIEEPVI